MLVKMTRLLARRSDATLVRLFGWIESGLRRLNADHPGIESIREIKEIFRDSPEERQVIRNLFLENRPAQAASFLRGFLRHHARSDTQTFDQQTAPARSGFSGSPTRMGFLGRHPDLDGLRAQYERRPDCTCVTVDFDSAPAHALASLDGIEIAGAVPNLDDWIRAAVSLARKISIHHASLNFSQVSGLLFPTNQDRTSIRIFYPYLYYPPVLKVRELIDQDVLGEVCTVRVRATLGGRGGALPPDPPDREAYLNHAAFDHFLLLALFGGAIEKVAAFLNPMDTKTGGQGQISCKYADPGRYGQLECTYAPGLYVRSTHQPYDLEAEVAGSNGIIWLRRGMGERIQAPPIFVRVGRSAYSIGVESGMRLRWEQVYADAAEEFLTGLRHGDDGLLSPAAKVSAFAARAMAYESTDKRKVLDCG